MAVLRAMRVFLVYGVVETFLLVQFRWLFEPRTDYRPVALGFALGCVALYAAAGALIGLAAWAVGRATGRNANRDAQAMAAATVLLLGAASGAVGLTQTREAVYVGVLALLAVLIVASRLWSRAEGFWFLSSPWVPALLLIAPSTTSALPAWVRSVALPATATIVVSAAWAAARRRSQSAAPGAGAGSFAAVGMLALATTLSAPLLQPAREPSRGFPNPPAGRRPPNIVLVTLDTVTARHLSTFGYARPTSPYLTAFARRATRFTRMIATGNYTLPTHASIFSGLYPTEHGARYWDPFGDAPLDRRVPVAAELLTDAGYATAGVAANTLYLSPDYGLSRGFALYDARSPAVMLPMLTPRFSLRHGMHSLIEASPSMAALSKEFRTGTEVNRSVFALLDDARFRSRPFFLFVNYMDAHQPYLPNDANRARFNATGPDELDSYDGAIATLDEAVGALIDRLESRALLDDALIVIVGDHGESFGDHENWEHPASLYQSQVHVPLLIKWPKQADARTVTAPVSGIDLLPTMLAAAGLPPARWSSGVDLAAVVDPGRAVFSEDLSFDQLDRGPGAAVFMGTLKFIRYQIGPAEMYDVDADPAENDDLYQKGDGRSAVLLERLDQWHPVARVTAPSGEARRTVKERLRSLGYVK